MTPPTLTSRRALLAVMLAGTMALGVGACGRRGRPVPPSDSPPQQKAQSAKNAQSGKAQPTFATRPTPDNDDNDEEEDQRAKDDPAGASPLPIQPSSKKPKPYAVPKQPFFLDFLM